MLFFSTFKPSFNLQIKLEDALASNNFYLVKFYIKEGASMDEQMIENIFKMRNKKLF
jgi:hypothetical protein